MLGDDDVELMLRVKEGDERAFGILIERHRDRVMGLVFRYLRDFNEAEDLSQEVFLNVFRARKSYRPEAKFSTWVFRITTNLCLNAIRSRVVRRKIKTLASYDPADASRPIEELADPKPGMAEEGMERQELAARVRQLVDELPEKQKLAVLLNKYEDCSYQEISEIMKLSVPAVKSLLSRARNRIKERLTPYLTRERVS